MEILNVISILIVLFYLYVVIDAYWRTHNIIKNFREERLKEVKADEKELKKIAENKSGADAILDLHNHFSELDLEKLQRIAHFSIDPGILAGCWLYHKYLLPWEMVSYTVNLKDKESAVISQYKVHITLDTDYAQKKED